MKFLYFLLPLLFGCVEQTESAVVNKIITLPEEVIVSNCSSDMVWVHGEYCPKVIQTCKSYMEPLQVTPFARCLEFHKTECVDQKKEMNFCIDREEYSETEDNIPMSNVSWTEAKEICEQKDKRLCNESEWEFACEGEEILPYTTGYVRPSSICNIDITNKVICKSVLCDYRKPTTDNLSCMSPFNVHNMSGNVDEWIEVPKYQHSKLPEEFMRSALKGGHWLPVRNRCRPKTVDHNELFRQVSVGFRCCQDIK